MTTYCRPLSTTYVMGMALPAAGRDHWASMRPVSRSKARSRWSGVPAANTNPPAVIMAPPRLSAPVESPSGTSHLMSPELRSTAVSAPQGGALQNVLRGVTSWRRIMPYAVPRCGVDCQSAFARDTDSNDARGTRRTIVAIRFVGVTAHALVGWTATPPQFEPPILPG